MAGTPRDSASWLTGDQGRGFTDTLGNRSSSCSIGLCPGGGGSSNSATRREGNRSPEATVGCGPRGRALRPLALPPFALPSLCPADTHIPVVLSVIVSVSVVLVIAAVESIIISPVSIVEVTVTLRKEREERRLRGFQAPDPLLSPSSVRHTSAGFYHRLNLPRASSARGTHSGGPGAALRDSPDHCAPPRHGAGSAGGGAGLTHPSVSRLPPVLLPVGPVVVASALPAHWKRNGRARSDSWRGPGAMAEWGSKRRSPRPLLPGSHHGN